MATQASPPSMGRLMAIGIVVAALVGGGAGFASGYFSRSAPAAQAREFYVLTVVLGFNDSFIEGLPPHDGFSPDQIIVYRGDSVTIHFYNTEDEEERHSFTMAAPYTMDNDLNWKENKTFTFTANTAGTFQFWCKYHLPSMTGSLTVLG